jgi:phenylacetic acid degradation operon negative regulatory protein
MPEKNSAVSRWIRTFLHEEPPRAKSLCVTVFGDSLAPHGGTVWLSSLIELLALFDISERLVRTSMFRLTAEGWVESERSGRRSLYALTASGRRRFEQAYRRVYSSPAKEWNGTWTLVLLPRSEKLGGERSALRSELEWEGFATLAPGLFAHPAANTDSLRAILHALDLDERAVVFAAQSEGGVLARPITDLVAQSWDLEAVAAAYRQIIERFEPLPRWFRDKRPIDPEQAFAVRTLLIHAFRRAVLQDPLLPADLLPAEWPGHRAYELCRDLYRLINKPAEAHLVRILGDEHPEGAHATPDFFERFGGLT